MKNDLIDQIPGWSKSRIAKEFGIDRRTVDKLLDGIEPSGQSPQGHDQWRVRDFAGPVSRYVDGKSNPGGVGEDGEFDPSRLMPAERRHWYESEVKRLKVETEKGHLIPAEDHEAALVDSYKSLKTTLITLPDVLERDVGLSPSQIERAENIVDVTLSELHQRLVIHE